MPNKTSSVHKTDIQPLSDFRSNAAAALKHLRDSGRPLVLTQRGRGAAVLLDIEVYQSLVEELETLRDIATSRAQIAEGRSVSDQEARRRLRARQR